MGPSLVSTKRAWKKRISLALNVKVSMQKIMTTKTKMKLPEKDGNIKVADMAPRLDRLEEPQAKKTRK